MADSTTLPELPLAPWRDTCATLHMCAQVVGKIRLVLTPLVNHWWNTTLYVTARGLTTSPIPYGDRAFEIELDFFDHQVVVRTDAGVARSVPLVARPVADFYAELRLVLRALDVDVHLYGTPVEVPDPIPFAADRTHASYDGAAVQRYFRALAWTDRVIKEFRGRFIGKCSPVHFFWGSFDLACTRFSGRPAPPRPGADAMTQEAYSHECISAGFWPGGGDIDGAAYYAYSAPQPAGFDAAPVRPAAAYYHRQLGEFVLPYEAVRTAPSPRDALLDFLQSTYEAGATRAGWDRAALERPSTD
jgi:uncharacterized protein DUF5996